MLAHQVHLALQDQEENKVSDLESLPRGPVNCLGASYAKNLVRNLASEPFVISREKYSNYYKIKNIFFLKKCSFLCKRHKRDK